jgi:hypothetical protein
MRQLCERLNEWWRPDPTQRVSFELEHTRIMIRVNGTLVGLFFIKNNRPYLHLINDAKLTAGLEYYVSRVLSASWNSVYLHIAETLPKS